MKLFEKLGEMLGFRLHDSEFIELQIQEEIIQQIPFNVPEMLAVQQQETKMAYACRRQAQSALDSALQLNNSQAAWENAYMHAQETDDIIQQLLGYRFRKLIITNISQDRLTSLFGASAIVLLGVYLSGMTTITHETFQLGMGMFIVGYITPMLLNSLLFTYSKELTQLLVPRTTTQKVLDAALLFNIHIVGMMPGELLASSNSLIYKIINSVDNVEELTTIRSTDDAPEEMCCAILHTVMTDPVGSTQSRHRFERAAILEWLKIREIHPCTKLPLTSDELTRDFKLKLAISRHVSTKLMSKQVREYPNGSLVNLSVFHQTIPCSNEEVMDKTARNYAALTL